MFLKKKKNLFGWDKVIGPNIYIYIYIYMVGIGLYLANPETLPPFPSSAGDYQNALMTFGTCIFYFLFLFFDKMGLGY